MNIKEEILYYINSSENNGAFLFAGKWGCGKSYLIKQIINEINNDEECKLAISIISLFGIDNISFLHSEVKNAYLEANSGLLGKKAQKVYKSMLKVAKESSSVVKAALPKDAAASAVSSGIASVASFDILNFISVKNTVGVTEEKKRKFVLVFDDFERCTIDISVLIGAINEYCENRNIKTILIADEEKIDNEKYKEFKEKLISRTIKINPDHTRTVHSIIENYLIDNIEYKNFIKKNEEYFQLAFNHSSYNNLRTLKSCIADFERVYEAWIESKIPTDDMENILYQFCAITYECKKGFYQKFHSDMYVIDSDLKVGVDQNGNNITEDDLNRQKQEIRNKYLPETFENIPSSLSAWVVDGYWDKNIFIDEIKCRYLVEDVSNETRFLNSNFWNLEQLDIVEGMPKAVEKSYKGELTCDELISLLQKTYALRYNEIELPCDIDYDKVKNGFEIRKSKIKRGEIEEPRRHTFAELSQIENEAKDIYKDIESLDELIYAWQTRGKFISCLKNNNIADTYSLKKKFLDCFDDELLELFEKCYSESLNSEKRQLCWSITGFDYNKSFENSDENVNETIDNFNKLKEFLTNHSNETEDYISKAIDKAFIDELDRKITEMKSE